MAGGGAATEDANPGATISSAGTQASMAGPAGFFTRPVRVDPLFPANDDINASGAYVTFKPARARPGTPIPKASTWW